MKPKLLLTATLIVLLSAVTAVAGNNCATIQSGSITDSAGQSVTVGYDQWGYNYQAHMFNGFYDNFTRPTVPATSGDTLMMAWNDAWLSNQDCDNNGKLDRHFGFPGYRGSGAWLTNHQRGTYTDNNGALQRFEYFVKIVAAPLDATLVGGSWVGSDGITIGPAIWGDFAILQEVSTDSGTGDHGLLYKTPASPGLGSFKP